MRILAAAALGAVLAFPALPAHADHVDCETYPDQCYDCVQAPCHPDEWVPYVLEKVFGPPER